MSKFWKAIGKLVGYDEKVVAMQERERYEAAQRSVNKAHDIAVADIRDQTQEAIRQNNAIVQSMYMNPQA